MRFKRIISTLLATLMLATQLPTTAFATDGGAPQVIDGAIHTTALSEAPSTGAGVVDVAPVSTQVSRPLVDNADIYPGIGNPGYVQMTESAQWIDRAKTEALVTVTFDKNYGEWEVGGGTLHTATVSIGSKLSAADIAATNTVNREGGYIFDGWYQTDQSGNITIPFDRTDAVINQNIIIKAKWRFPNVNVIFDLDYVPDGSDTSILITVPTEMGIAFGKELPVPGARPGYNFAEWLTKGQGGEFNRPFAATEVVGEAMTVKAKWTPIPKVTVIFDLDYTPEGSATSVWKTVDTDRGYSLGMSFPAEKPTRPGYRFEKWVAGGQGGAFDAGYSVSDNMTVKAQWIQTADVTFDLGYDGSASPTTVTVDIGSTVGNSWPQNPTREGFDFNGWFLDNGSGAPGGIDYKSDSAINGNTKLVAKWTAQPVTQVVVTFDLDYTPEGSATSVWKTVSTTQGSSLGGNFPAEKPTRPGYRFEKWVAGGQGGAFDAGYSVSDNMTVKAQWIQTADVIFDLGYTGGVTPPTVTVDIGFAVGSNWPQNPTRTGFDFEGWFLDDGSGAPGGIGYKSDSTITGNTKLVAKWTAQPVQQATVTFDVGYTLDSGSNTYTKVLVDKSTALGTEKWPSDPERAGYTFNGWYQMDANGGITTTAFEKITKVEGNMTVMAKWEKTPGKVIVSFEYSGGSATGPPPSPPPQEITQGGKATIPGNETLPQGWLVENWYQKNLDGSIVDTPYDFTKPVDDDITLVGVLTKDRQWVYRVTYNGNGGTGSVVDGKQYLTEDTVTVLPPNGLVNGEKVFLTWNTGPDGSGSSYQSNDTFLITENTTLYAIWGDPGAAPIQILHKYYVNRTGTPEQVSGTTEVRDVVPGQIFSTENLRNDLGRYRYWKTDVEVVAIPKSKAAGTGVLTTAQREAEITRLTAAVSAGKMKLTEELQRILTAHPDISETQVREMIATVQRLRGSYGDTSATQVREKVLALERELMALDETFEPTMLARPNGPDTSIQPPVTEPASPVSPDLSDGEPPAPPADAQPPTESEHPNPTEPIAPSMPAEPTAPTEPSAAPEESDVEDTLTEGLIPLSSPAEVPPSSWEDSEPVITPLGLENDYGRLSGMVLDSGYTKPESGDVAEPPAQGGSTSPETLIKLLQEHEKALATYQTLTELERLEAIVGPAVEDTIELAKAQDALADLLAADDTIPPMSGESGRLATKAVSLKDGEILYEEGYIYLVTISYSRTVNSGGGGNDPDPEPTPPVVPPTPTPTPTPPPTPPSGGGNGGNGGGGGNDTIIIPDGATPLTENPELFTIFGEDVPLGNLPQTGGTTALVMGQMGGCALLLGAILLLFKRKED